MDHPYGIRAIVACVVALMLPAEAAAQIVNVVPDAIAAGPEGWSGELSGSLRQLVGNNDLFVIDGSGVAHLRSGVPCAWCLDRGITTHHAFLRAGGRWIEPNGTVASAGTLSHLRYQYTPWVRFGAEAFGQHEYDRFRRIAVRALAGIGLRAYAFTTSWVDGLIGSAYLVERETLSDRAGAPDSGATTWAHRSSSYALIVVRLSHAVTATLTGFAQPDVRDVEDIRVLGDATIAVRANTWITLRPSFTMSYDARPPFGVQRRDRSFQTAIAITF